jgi:hypothetical protein
MELISKASTAYLLPPSLESLHAESREWKSEMEFWNDEMAFFYRLIHLREPHAGFPSEAVADLEMELVKITGGKLMEIKTALENHERILAQVIDDTPLVGDQEYRLRHGALKEEVNGLRAVIRNFKKGVFSFI